MPSYPYARLPSSAPVVAWSSGQSDMSHPHLGRG
jgi:hypothetical protein